MRRKTGQKKRAAVLLLAASMVFSRLPVQAAGFENVAGADGELMEGTGAFVRESGFPEEGGQPAGDGSLTTAGFSEAGEEPLDLGVQETLQASGPATVSTYDQFMTALKNGNTPITVSRLITLVDTADPDGRLVPIKIPGNVEIIGNGPDSCLVSRAPIQLTGDGVTFRNLGLIFNSSDALDSVPHREIFLAGHSLTLDNVNTYLKGNTSLGGFGSSEEELLPTVYAGAYRGTDSGSIGNKASLTVKNANSQTMFKSIVMGHGDGGYEMVPYKGSAELNLNARTLSREGIFTHENSSASIKITGENTSSVRIEQFTGNEQTTLTLSNALLLDGKMNGVGTVSLESNSRLGLASGELGNVSVPGGTSLRLTDLGNAVINGDFTGGGELELDANGSVAIKGNITGTTTVAAGDFLSPQPLTAGKTYIMGKEGADAFKLDDHLVYADRFSLDYVDGKGWVASQLYTDQTVPEIGSIEILSAPTAVNQNELKDQANSIDFQIVWRDKAGVTISSRDVYYEGFYQSGTDGEYSIILKDEYLTDNKNDGDVYSLSGLMLEKEEDDLSDFYALHNGLSGGTLKDGKYTLLLFSESVDLSTPDTETDEVTLGDVKERIKGKILAQTSFDLYTPSEPDAGKTDIAVANIDPIPNQTYTGRPITPPVTVTHSNQTLTPGTDYVVSYSNNQAPGEAAVTVTGIGNYSGTATAKFQIVKADSNLTLTVNGSSQATAQYGDTLRFVFQAKAPTKKARRAARAAENTVEFVSGDQVLGTAAVGADGQAVFTYRTTERKLPIGASQIGVRFGGSAGLNPAEQTNLVTVTLNQATLPEKDIISIALQDFTYDGKTKEAELLYMTLADGSMVDLEGKAELDNVTAGSYASAKVLNWSMTGEDAKWYTLPAAPDSITVDPAARILKKEHPAPADQYLAVKPGGTGQHSMAGLLPEETPENTTVDPEFAAKNVEVSYQNGSLTVKAKRGAKDVRGTVAFEYKNYQTVTAGLHITVTEEQVTPPVIRAADWVFNGQSYNGVTGSNLDQVNLTYYDLNEQKALPAAPTEAGRYSVTATWKDGKPGVTSVDFNITPYPITVQAKDRTIQTGESVPSLAAPKEGTDYTLLAKPIAGYDLGTVRMAYEGTPSSAAAGSYSILIAVADPNRNYDITTEEGTLTVEEKTTGGGGSGGGGGSTGGGGTGGGGTGGGGGSGEGEQPTPTPPATGETKPVKPNASGDAAVDLGALQDAIDKAKPQAGENGVAVAVPVIPKEDKHSFGVILASQALDLLVREQVKQLEIQVEGAVTGGFDETLLRWLDTAAAGRDVTLRVKRVDALVSSKFKEAVGGRPTYDLSLSYLDEGRETPVEGLGGNAMTVRLPYTPAKGEETGNLRAVTADGKGGVNWIETSRYDAEKKAVVFETAHPGVCGVGYRKPASQAPDRN